MTRRRTPRAGTARQAVARRWPGLALPLLGALWLATPAQAGPILTLNPTDGALRGLPGQTVGWGFELFNDEHFLVVTGADFPASLTIGSFIDFISQQFFVVGPTPEVDSVTQVFDPVALTGIGAFVIDPFAPIGGLARGLLTLTYDLFSRSPNDPNFDPDQDIVSLDNRLPAQVSVGVPAPPPLLLVLAGVLGLWRWSRPGCQSSVRPRWRRP